VFGAAGLCGVTAAGQGALVPMIGYAWPLLVWWVREVRGQFRDDWELPPATPCGIAGRVGPVSRAGR
jgi:hypothetical protein